MDEKSLRPLISIVTVSFNAVQTIERTILSVINQTYENIEYIIIDGGSTDGTVDVIKKYADCITYWVSESDKGIYDAMNKGISHATGDFIGIINSDDWYADDALQIIADGVCFNPDVDLFYGDMVVFYSDGHQNIRYSDHRKLRKQVSINHPTCFVRALIYQKKHFSSVYKIAGDYDFMLWCFINECKFYNLNKIIAYFSPGGVSSIPSIKHLDAFYIWKKYFGIYVASWLFLREFIVKIWKYPIKKVLIFTLGNKRYWELLARCK